MIQVLGFRSDAGEASVLGCHAILLYDRCMMFRISMVSSSSRVDIPQPLKMKPPCCLNMLGSKHPVTQCHIPEEQRFQNWSIFVKAKMNYLIQALTFSCRQADKHYISGPWSRNGTLRSWKSAPRSAPANLQYIDSHGRYRNQSGQSYSEISSILL